MTLILKITANTTDLEMKNTIPYLDMRKVAAMARDNAAQFVEMCKRDDMPYDSQKLENSMLEYHVLADEVAVLWSPHLYGWVNQKSCDVGNSLAFYVDDYIASPVAARRRWLEGEACDAN